MDKARRRLQQLQDTLGAQSNHSLLTVRKIAGSEPSPFIVLPDDARVDVFQESDGHFVVSVDHEDVLKYNRLARQSSLILSAKGTPFENLPNVHIPKYAILEVTSAGNSAISISNFWAAIYGLWTSFHDQEHIPIIISPTFVNHNELTDYLLYSGLARTKLEACARRVDHTKNEIFLVRASFWQGAGTGPSWKNERGWLRGMYADQTSTFPQTQSFTRTPLVISAHPLRPPKPKPGDCIYKRYCLPVKKMLSFHMFDPNNDLYMDTFHRWHNDEVVNKGWGEKGTMERHREYIRRQIEDPHVSPLLMSWDDELMGYAELVWIKENHLSAYVPDVLHDFDRGLHVLCGEAKYRGGDYGQSWFRSLTHYIFLADPRTAKIIGEPKRINGAIIKMSIDAGMHLQTTFDFPYKRSVMTMNLRERFFKEDMLI